MKGWLYVLKNPSLNGMYKIGYSNRDPIERCNELSNTSLPHNYEIVYTVLIENADTLEQKVHQSLNEYRVVSNREFFNTSIEIIKTEIDKSIQFLGLKALYEEDKSNRIDDRIATAITFDDIKNFKQRIIDVYQSKIDENPRSYEDYYYEFLIKNKPIFISKLDSQLSDSVMRNWYYSINSQIHINQEESKEWIYEYMEGLISTQISSLLHEYGIQLDKN